MKAELRAIPGDCKCSQVFTEIISRAPRCIKI